MCLFVQEHEEAYYWHEVQRKESAMERGGAASICFRKTDRPPAQSVTLLCSAAKRLVGSIISALMSETQIDCIRWVREAAQDGCPLKDKTDNTERRS